MITRAMLLALPRPVVQTLGDQVSVAIDGVQTKAFENLVSITGKSSHDITADDLIALAAAGTKLRTLTQADERLSLLLGNWDTGGRPPRTHGDDMTDDPSWEGDPETFSSQPVDYEGEWRAGVWR